MGEVKSIKSILRQKSGINTDQVLFKKDGSFRSEIPQKIKKAYESISKKWVDKDDKNRFKNQDSLCVSHFHMKDKKLYLNFCEEKYVLRQSLSETVSSLTSIEQDYLLSEINQGKAKIPLAYKLNIVVITKDSKLVFVKRSNKVSTNKNRYDLGVSKGVKPDDYNGRSFQPLVSAIRAMKEELGLSLDSKEVVETGAFKVQEFYLNREIFSLGFMCLFDLRKLDKKDFTFEKIQSLANAAKNSWEFSEILSLDLNKRILTKFIKENLNKITNYSLYNLIQLINDL